MKAKYDDDVLKSESQYDDDRLTRGQYDDDRLRSESAIWLR